MKVTGPMLSFGASGSIGGTATFATWKGRPYVRQTVIPSNPRTPGQVAQRAMMKFIAQQWSGVASPDKATWETLAQQGNFSQFNAYVKYNLQRWAMDDAPTKAFPASSGANGATWGPLSAAGATRSIVLTMTNIIPNLNWGLIITRVVGAVPSTAKTDTVAVIAWDGVATLTYTDTGLLSATQYSYQVSAFSTSGYRNGTSLSATANTL